MKLLIISEDAGAIIACGRGTGNYYIISDGLIMSTVSISLHGFMYLWLSLFFGTLIACCACNGLTYIRELASVLSIYYHNNIRTTQACIIIITVYTTTVYANINITFLFL
jgi:hypothetical protein